MQQSIHLTGGTSVVSGTGKPLVGNLALKDDGTQCKTLNSSNPNIVFHNLRKANNNSSMNAANDQSIVEGA